MIEGTIDFFETEKHKLVNCDACTCSIRAIFIIYVLCSERERDDAPSAAV